jgi:hypothetical protein
MEEEQHMFETFKGLVTSEPVLAHPDLEQPFELKVDASGFVLGAVLLQRKEDRKKHPIAYYSSTLNKAERNYDIWDLELLAIIKPLRQWRLLLGGSPHKIKVYLDHMNLQYWKQPHKTSQQVAREVLELTEYDLEIHHIKGTASRRADALSQRPDYDQGDHDNKNVIVLPDKVFIHNLITKIVAEPLLGTQDVLLPDDMTKTQPIYYQNEDILRPWVDAH